MPLQEFKGLTGAEVSRLQAEVGFNELPASGPRGIWRIAREVMQEPMFILLMGCSSLYLVLGDYREGLIMICSVLVIILITFLQHRKTERSLEALRQLASPRALVVRNGVELRIAGREVVPGDILLLHEGDRVPADARILECSFLCVDESLLTGESVAVQKDKSDPALDSVFSGTLVVKGSGVAEVLATGVRTRFGQIGSSLGAIEKGATRLQAEMRVLIRHLFLAGIGASIIIVAAFYFTRGQFLQSLLNGLSAAIALLPEEFPVVLTIFLALGAWRLSRQRVLTRTPAAIETLGSATVLCSDKTGTITQNKMEVAVLYDGGEVYHREVFPDSRQSIFNLLDGLYHASQPHAVDPMEMAISRTCKGLFPQSPECELVREYSLGHGLLAMTRVVRRSPDAPLAAWCKGAPEAVFALCKLDEGEVSQHLAVVHRFAAQGYRVLAAARCISVPDVLPGEQQGFRFSFAGLVGFEDPIRPEVPKAVKECQAAGIRVIMITGDYPATARSIAEQIGLGDGGPVITGAELQGMADEELRERIRQVHVFARIVPEQKLQIIRALKANGEIVAMTGDGVNDAPALKAADIGVAMGLKGTDVAREASSLVLLDDHFASIVMAIRQGRRIFDNLGKAMSYIMAIHIPIFGLVLIPVFNPMLPILLMPLHIVFMELIIDPVCSIAFESEQEERGIMSRPPRPPAERFFGWSSMWRSILKGGLLLVMVTGVYALSIREGHPEEEVRAIAFSALIIGNVFLILTSLSGTRSFLTVLREKNWSLMIIVTMAIAALLLTITIPPLQQIFHFRFPGYSHFILSIGGALVMLFVLEGCKRVRRNEHG